MSAIRQHKMAGRQPDQQGGAQPRRGKKDVNMLQCLQRVYGNQTIQRAVSCDCKRDEDEESVSHPLPGSVLVGRKATSARTGSKCNCSEDAVRSLSRRLGQSKPLPPRIRRQLESLFGTSLSRLKVHSDDKAAQVCAERGALALVAGNHIAFAHSRFQPGSMVGKALIAHEVAHALQVQNTSASRTGIEAGIDAPDHLTPTSHPLGAVRSRSTLSRMLDLWKQLTSGSMATVEATRTLVNATRTLSMTACDGKNANNSCRVTGSFSSIPSGNVAATLTGSKLGASFNMVGDFQPDEEGCTNCACGEYRQEVKGSFKSNGSVVTHRLCGTNLSSSYQEDCVRIGGTDYKYGYRSIPFANSKFTPNQQTGCRFEGHDEPGITGSSGDALEVDLGFRGKLIDVCDGNRELAVSEWTVKGTATVP